MPKSLISSSPCRIRHVNHNQKLTMASMRELANGGESPESDVLASAFGYYIKSFRLQTSTDCLIAVKSIISKCRNFAKASPDISILGRRDFFFDFISILVINSGMCSLSYINVMAFSVSERDASSSHVSFLRLVEACGRQIDKICRIIYFCFMRLEGSSRGRPHI